MFSYGKSYSSPFCQTVKDENCAINIFDDVNGKIENNFTKKVDFKCKHSCTILQYSGLEITEASKYYKPESFDYYELNYQYLIYDSMGMIGSVGGTFGMFIGFSMTGVISTIIEFFKESKIGRNILV